METLTGQQLVAQMHWRYATQKFDPAKKIPTSDWAALEAALVLTPSSYGVQPWRFIVVTDSALREMLLPATWNQRQVVECSHFVVFAVPTFMTEEIVDRHVARTVKIRGGAPESMTRFRDVVVRGIVTSQTKEQSREWAARQVYIALGNFMTSAAAIGIDTCPMEGFKPAEYDRILQLDSRGYASIVCCAAGFRNSDDRYAALPKVRFPREEIIESR